MVGSFTLKDCYCLNKGERKEGLGLNHRVWPWLRGDVWEHILLPLRAVQGKRATVGVLVFKGRKGWLREGRSEMRETYFKPGLALQIMVQSGFWVWKD